MAILVVERGPDSGKRFALTDFPLTIGRDKANNISLNDEEISRFHLRIKKRGRLTILEDLESKNGSFINGDRVMNAILNSGDKLLIGSSELVYLASQPFLQLTQDFLNFDMVVAEDDGISGPIVIGESNKKKSFKPTRLSENKNASLANLDSKSSRLVSEYEADIISIAELDEAIASLLKSMQKLLPSLARVVLFTWIEPANQLVPSGIRHFSNKKNSFLISQRALEDVLARKQGLILNRENGSTTESGPLRAIIPMINLDRILALVHCEFTNDSNSLTPKDFESVQSLITRCASHFDSMLLRKELDGWLVGMIDTLVAITEAKDTYTRGHSERVSRFSLAVADELKLNRDTKKLLMISSLCHDIGKIGVPDAILKKASLLSPEEYNEMKLHPTLGAEIISNMPHAQRFLGGVKHHHEKWDGTGYPDGLAGEDIPFFGRIVAIADVFDAMISGRSYSGFMDQEDAVQKISKEKDLFDPEIIKAFVKAYERGRLTLKTHTLNQESPEAVAKKFNLASFGEDAGVYGGTRAKK